MREQTRKYSEHHRYARRLKTPTQVQSPQHPDHFPRISLVWQRTQEPGQTVAWNMGQRTKPDVASDESSMTELNTIEPRLEAPQAQAAVGRNIGPFWLPPPKSSREQRFDREVTWRLKFWWIKGETTVPACEIFAEEVFGRCASCGRRPFIPRSNTPRPSSWFESPCGCSNGPFGKDHSTIYGVFRAVDLPSCRWAAKRSIELLPPGFDASFEVVIKGIGRHSLSSIATLCEQALVVELSEREFPQIKGRRNLRRLAQKVYERANPEYKVYRTSVPNAWQSDGNNFYLRAVMGVERDTRLSSNPL